MKKKAYANIALFFILLPFICHRSAWKWGNETMQENSEHEYRNGIVNPKSITPDEVMNPDDINVLINKYYSLADGWTPNDLIAVTSNNEREMYLRKEAGEAWEKLRLAARNDGFIIQMVSSYRTKEYQTNLFNKNFEENAFDAFRYSAMPRRSEHELGLAMDISYDWQLHYDLDEHPLGIWLKNHASSYGFILRYPKDKERITQYSFEPWHYRYVGKTLAMYLDEHSMTLEEYYEK